ncbi:faeA-like family protein [Escherichia coli]
MNGYNNAKKDNYSVIIDVIKYELVCGKPWLSTRQIADATNMTIYQARQYLIALNEAGVVGRTGGGKGGRTLWSLNY